MVKPSFLGLNAVQRQSLVISLTAFFTGLLVIALISVLVLITARGGAYFWPEPIYAVSIKSDNGQQSTTLLANVFDDDAKKEIRLKYADVNNPYGTQLLVERERVERIALAKDSAQIKLNDGRQVLAIPDHVITPEGTNNQLSELPQVMQKVALLSEKITTLNTQFLAPIHEALSRFDNRDVAADAPAREKRVAEFNQYQQQVLNLERQREQYQLAVKFADGQSFIIPVSNIQSVDFVGRLSLLEKWQVAISEVIIFLTESPKQANTSGGVFPALFGTVLMVFIMTIIVTPFGVLAAIYLSEYAPNTALTTVIRVSVSNMAGVPSIVYGVFGLGFFVYTLGGSIDSLLFSDTLPSPTMGSPGIFWAALTMAILTLPVVIVATEEGLRRVPEGLKAGSYALGATKIETIVRTILPIASPGIMTGVILAIARAAGEVAPLMLVGAVKFAPALPIDGEFPFLHLDRQFMHLGVLIYDSAFHSQTDAKSASMMFAACLLLLIVVFVLNILAVLLRTRLRKRYLEG
ncbi:MAG: phosphate ABC transporter, permease protein PstA [Alteromonas sp.]|jgi:phosphate transport system permease protein|uniref:phosphate ABC transporter permease PstA n=1 Tax=Alteromonas sp. MB-3u-76 TaxID=2058133 RepID=UPI000C306C21|nr:phosphate ABC transporter permease PstA [Alteromonas sp. MB-3u-76]AUC87463.1 phosphate ABC transporter, permease protein PstA [Alteromonas sp. MB-3u-76]MAI65759.1 phosphate ABC transporter, permease protein PstA [Alteromonas sp.]